MTTQAQWKTIYDHISPMSVDDVVTYSQLQALLPDTLWKGVIAAFHQARKRLSNEKRLDFENVRGEGYRLINAKTVIRKKDAATEPVKKAAAKKAPSKVTVIAPVTDGLDYRVRYLESRVASIEDALRRISSDL